MCNDVSAISRLLFIPHYTEYSVFSLRALSHPLSCESSFLDLLLVSTRAKNILSQSVHLCTLSTTNKNTQKTIENEGKITFHLGRKHRPSHRAFAVEKNNSRRKSVRQVVFRFSWEIFTLSGSTYNFLKFYRFPSQNIVVNWRYILL